MRRSRAVKPKLLRIFIYLFLSAYERMHLTHTLRTHTRSRLSCIPHFKFGYHYLLKCLCLCSSRYLQYPFDIHFFFFLFFFASGVL